MAKKKLETPYVVPKEELKAFRLRLQYGRRLGSREVFLVDKVTFSRLFAEGFSMDSVEAGVVRGAFPSFVLLAAMLLPRAGGPAIGSMFGERALLTLRVRRNLPPYQSTQRYVVGDSVATVMAKVDSPKRERVPKARTATGARRLVSLEG